MAFARKTIQPDFLKVVVRNQGTKHMIRNVFKPFFGLDWNEFKKLSAKQLIKEIEHRIQSSVHIALKDLETKTNVSFQSVFEKTISKNQIENKLRAIAACRPYCDYTVQLDDEFKEQTKLNPCDNSNLCPWCFARAMEEFIAKLKQWDCDEFFMQSYVLKFPLAEDRMAWELKDAKKAFCELIAKTTKTDIGAYIVTQDWFNAFTTIDKVKDQSHYRPRKVLFHTFLKGSHEDVKNLMEVGILKEIYAPNGSKKYRDRYIDKESLNEEIPTLVPFDFANVYENWPNQLGQFLGLYHDFSCFGQIKSEKV